MNRERNEKDYSAWLDFWSNQSKEFFASAEKNLQAFTGNPMFNPEENKKQIQDWLETLKTQWQNAQFTAQQEAQAAYFKSLNKMCIEASEVMVQTWMKRSKDNDPIKNIRELYELWLNCCHDIYQRSLRTKSYQNAYIDFMNETFKFWQAYNPK